MLPYSEQSAYDLQKNVSDFKWTGAYPNDSHVAHDYLSHSDEVFHEFVKLGATTVLSTDTFTALYSFNKTYPNRLPS